MATSTRLKGNGNLFFTLKRGTGSAVAFNEDMKAFTISYEDKDAADVTFSEATLGIGKNVVMTGTAITSFDSTALFKYLWDNAGAADILVTVGPKGNATPNATGSPHYQFTASIPGKPELSNEANADPNGAGAEFEFTLNGSSDIVWKTA